MAKFGLVGLVALVTIAGCATSVEQGAVLKSVSPGVSTPTGDPSSGGEVGTDDPGIDEPITPMGDPGDLGNGATSEGADAVMVAAARDVEEFWGQTYPEVYGDAYEPIKGGYWSYGPDTPSDLLPPCGFTYEELAENAFYCEAEDLIAWDREALIGPFIDEYGAFTAAIIMAHELGHAVQARTGDFGTLPTVVAELQADCFAGSWVARVVDGKSDSFEADADELDVAVAGLIAIRDVPGSSPDDLSAHGSGFDRVSAFADGFEDGATRCSRFGTEPPQITEVDDPEVEGGGGDLPTEQLIPLLSDDLEDFYTVLASSQNLTWEPVKGVVRFDPADAGDDCADSGDEGEQVFFCEADDSVYIDAINLIPSLESIGDFAIASELARQWAFSYQEQAGSEPEDPSLNADCLTGLYSADVFNRVRPSSEFALSAGDLDEVIISFLAFGETDTTTSPFERADAFRTGFVGAASDCDAVG